MKKSISLILIMLVSAISLVAQTIIIKTQEDINSFNYETVDNLIIKNINDITALSGFNTLKLIKYDLIIDSNSFTSFAGFNNLEHINGMLRMMDNPGLKTINAFSKLQSIGNLLVLIRNRLEEISDFSSLTDIYMVEISNCYLKNVNFLSHIQTAEAGLIIQDNNQLLNLDGFSNLKCVEFLSIRSNAKLENLNGLSGITKSKDTDIQYNNALTELSGLEALDSVETNLYIGHNENLISVNAIKNISFIKGSLSIWANPKLSECNLISNLVNNPAVVQKEVSIHDNLSGCNFNDLKTGIPITTAQDIRIYPNPGRDQTVIEFENSNSGYSLQIYNMRGSLVHSYQNINSPFTIQWKDEQQGIYFYQLSSDNREIQSGKIVVE